MRRRLVFAVVFLLMATAAYAELWPTLKEYLKDCTLIILCTTEIKDGKALYKVDEVWVGEYAPGKFRNSPPAGYVVEDEGGAVPKPEAGQRIVFFYTDYSDRRSTAFPVKDGKIVYASTGNPGTPREFSLYGFKRQILWLTTLQSNPDYGWQVLLLCVIIVSIVALVVVFGFGSPPATARAATAGATGRTAATVPVPPRNQAKRG